jgi:hypothetical protein
MMKSVEQLKKSTMRRIYAVWFVRKVASPAVVKFAIVIAILWRLKEYVSLRQVIANAPSLAAPTQVALFFEHAFANTQFVVQGLVLALIVFALWCARDLIKGYAVLGLKTI